MNSHNTAILAGTIVAVVAIVAIALMIPQTSGSVTEETDFVGHWYLVHYEYYDDEGIGQTRNISDDPVISLRDLDVYTASNGLFSGLFMNTNIAGTFSNERLNFGLYIGNTEYTGFGILHNDGHLNMMLTETVYQDGGIANVTSYSMTYATYREVVDMSLDQANITGIWKSFESTWYNGDILELGDMTADISQSGDLIRVNLQGKDLDITLEGILSTQESGTAIGYLMDSRCNAWYLTIRDNRTLELGSAMNDNGMLGVVSMLMSRDGAPTDEHIVIDLQDTKWRSMANSTCDPFGNLISVTNKYYLEFTTQNGNSVMGYLHSGPRTYPLAVYLSQDSVTRVNYSVSYDGGTILTSNGWISNDRMYTGETRYLQNALYSSLTTFERITDEPEDYDIVGHWYTSNSIGYEDDDEYVEYNHDDLNDRDLDIYEIRDGLLFGRYLGGNVTGSYIGGVIIISCENHLDGGTATIHGWVMDESTMALNEVFYRDRPDGSMSYNVYSTIVSRDNGASINEDVIADMVGEWRLHSGYVFDGTTVKLSDMTLTIEEYNHNVFCGTMSDVAGNEIGIHGALTSKTLTGEASGMISGATGGIWYVNLDDGVLTTKHVGETDDTRDMTTTVCAYVKDSATTDPKDDRDVYIEGMWKATNITTISDTGIWDSADFQYIIDVKAQDGICAVGIGYQPNLEGRFSLVMTANVYGDISIVTAGDYGLDTIDSGYGWVDESDPDRLRIYLVETYVNLGGHWMTQMSCFERYDIPTSADI